jgi:hypothetical protein
MKIIDLCVMTCALLILCLGLLELEGCSPGAAAEKRSKVIDFENEVVEGLNKQPLDSLSSLSEAEKRRRKPHLYRKRAGFRSETADTLRVMHGTP